MLDMGEPVKIADVAERFADQHIPPLEIVYTGLRQGEKLHEDLVAAGETGDRPFHPMITHVHTPGISPDEIRIADNATAADLIAFMSHPLTLANI